MKIEQPENPDNLENLPYAEPVDLSESDDGDRWAVRVVRLSKFFGTLQVLRQVSFEAEHGDIFGLIGPNGAGKTTLLKILSTLIYPNYGSAYINGRSVAGGPRTIRKLIGYMPDMFGYYEELTVEEYLHFYATIFRIPFNEQEMVISESLEKTDLALKKHAVVSRLSRGMQQRLQIARILLHDPKVLLLDEPAAGLDPRARVDLKTIIRNLSKAGKTAIISSHVLGDLDGFVNRVGILERGRMLYAGTVRNLTMDLAPERRFDVRLGSLEQAAAAAGTVAGMEQVSSCEPEGNVLKVRMKRNGSGAGELARVCRSADADVLSIEEKGLELQDAFMMVTKGLVS
jgi:ABC-2 type transport system ATP-binding protein